jgi:hypothetical protein
MESFLSLGSIMAFRSDRFPADRTFFEKLFLDKELADLALQMRGAAFLLLGGLVSSVFALEDRWHVILKVLLPCADLGGGDVVLLGDLVNTLFALERLGGDAGFTLRSGVFFFVSSESDFGVIRPSQTR